MGWIWKNKNNWIIIRSHSLLSLCSTKFSKLEFPILGQGTNYQDGNYGGFTVTSSSTFNNSSSTTTTGSLGFDSDFMSKVNDQSANTYNYQQPRASIFQEPQNYGGVQVVGQGKY